MRILYLCEYATLNGGENSLLAVLDGLAANGCQPVVACPAGPLADVVVKRGLEWHTLRFHDDSSARLPALEIDQQIAELCRRVGPAIVHANSLSMSRLLGRVAEQIQLPTVGHLRDIINLSRAAIGHLNNNDRLIAVSQATRQHHLSQGMDSEKTFVCYNGIDTRQFQTAARGKLRREYGLQDSDTVVLTIGQLGLRKGLDVVVQAVKEMADQKTIHWFLVGERHSQKAESIAFHEELIAASQQPPWQGRLHLLGRRADVPQLLCDADIIVHAARQEPLGRVLLEAAAAARAIVATDVGGTREIFPDDEALLVPPDDATALKQAMLELATDRGRRQDLAERAFHRIATAFSIDRVVQSLLGHYQAVRRP